MTDYVKLSSLVDKEFTVEAVADHVYKKWDTEANKMLLSRSFEAGYRKLYPVTTDKGQLDLGSGQIGSLLEAVMDGGKSDLIGRTFHVKSNGKSGMDIRYFFNPVEPKDEPIAGEGEEEWNDAEYQ